MRFIKYWAPGPRFNPYKFAELAQSVDIICAPVREGVVIDRDKLNSIPGGSLPTWLFVNRKSINNPWCTTEPTDSDAQEAFDY